MVRQFTAIVRRYAIQKPALARSFGGAAAAAAAADRRPSDGEVPAFGRVVAGIIAAAAAASGAGLMLLAPSEQQVSFSDSGSHELDQLASQAPDQGRRPRFLLADSYRRRVFFSYEKRIRLLSPPEKIFEYFASFRSSEGEIFMLPTDLMRAIVPVFPPSESNIIREGHLRGEQNPGELHCPTSSFFMLFDTDSDGLISFSEYIFFVTLLSIPESSFSAAFKMFDLDNNGVIKRDEFEKVMALMRTHSRQGACHKNGLRIGLKVGRSKENASLMEYLFDKDGNGSLQHDKFVTFLRDLHDEELNCLHRFAFLDVNSGPGCCGLCFNCSFFFPDAEELLFFFSQIVRLEFAHYDFGSKGTIPAKDFAFSLVASADLHHINKFLNRVDDLDRDEHLSSMRITFEEFKALAELRRKLRHLTLALFCFGQFNGLMTKRDFQRAASNVCDVSISDNVVDVIFHVFDTNSDRSLSSEEFLRALHGRERDLRQPNVSHVSRLVPSWLSNRWGKGAPSTLHE